MGKTQLDRITPKSIRDRLADAGIIDDAAADLLAIICRHPAEASEVLANHARFPGTVREQLEKWARERK